MTATVSMALSFAEQATLACKAADRLEHGRQTNSNGNSNEPACSNGGGFCHEKEARDTDEQIGVCVRQAEAGTPIG